MQSIAVFPAEKAIRLIDHAAPQIARPDEVIVQILDVGICGTDREIARFDYGGPPLGSPYLIIGHESLGEVVEVGAAVTRVEPGDLVVTMVRRPCSHRECRACARGGGPEARAEGRRRFLEPLLAGVERGGLGHLGEIADADPPHAAARFRRGQWLRRCASISTWSARPGHESSARRVTGQREDAKVNAPRTVPIKSDPAPAAQTQYDP